ncbi:cupin domain-containing protein [Glacieibacterium sp.]|uniref:cupin domain-containing protein n=1 Tax=Glacieibacterium sp. TaxID=2860237 RepID=UPI003B006514
MRHTRTLLIAALAVTGFAAASAQTPETVPKGPAPGDPYAQFYPDPTHIPFFRPETIPWTGEAGKEQQYNVYGDPRKPGPYAMLLKWFPGAYSKPHFHGMPRYIVVVSGTWWVSSSAKYDPTKTYPLGPGSVVSDVVNTVHWDGARDAPVVLMIVGEGPVPNVLVDENGKPINKKSF